jgi:hypothetical protein
LFFSLFSGCYFYVIKFVVAFGSVGCFLFLLVLIFP